MAATDRLRRDTLLVVGAPLVLAVLELFHPYPHDLFQLPLPRWLTVRYLQILLFPLSARAVATSGRGLEGVAAVGALAAAVAIWRGASWMPVALFAVAALGLFVFKSQGWPGGPLSFGASAAGGAWWRGQQTQVA